MNIRLRLISAALAIFVILPTTTTSAVDKTRLRKTAEENASFGCDLYQRLRKTQGNLFFSPYSISIALAMTYAGARGNTEKEMAKVLHFSLPQAALHQTFSDLQAHMVEIQRKGLVRLNLANSLWMQSGYPFFDEFLALNKKYYGSEPHFVDFAGQEEVSRIAINTWVEKETENKIKDLIKPGALVPSTTLVLCNAIYFKGSWANQFKKRLTNDSDFFITPAKTVRVPMMSQTSEFTMKVFDNFSAVELPYKGYELSMVILLPKTLDGLKQVENVLTGDNIKKWIDALTKTHSTAIVLKLPRFKTVREFELADDFAKMGMPSAFRDADFSGMTDRHNLFISNVIHKAFISVNEEGTEAAAASAAVIMKSASRRARGQVPEFRIDHPFIFLIREAQTGSILFVGRVVNPTK